MAAKAEDINLPKVQNPMPAIFVLLDKDLTVPIEGRRDRIDRAKKMIASIDYYTTGVKRGIIHLTEMDRKRILAEHNRYLETYGQTPAVPNMPPEEADNMIQAMSCNPVEGYDYNYANEQLKPDFRRQLDKPDGEDTLRQLQLLVEDGIRNLKGYEDTMATIRKRWTDILEREQRLMNQKFGQATSAPTADMGKGGDIGSGSEEMELD